MAKRKRLTPLLGPSPAPPPASARPPIAAIAGEAATQAAFDAVQSELASARAEGRMVVSLPLSAIDASYLIRDRIAVRDEAFDSLKDSLARRGQQTPIEVVDLGGGTYGLISGARRMRALDLLATETMEPRFRQVQALIRQPEDRVDTYVAMIEENEIRADLSYYERARIAHKAVEAGVFETPKAALQSLYAGASFSRRSKIKTFMTLVRAFDDVLRYPAQITERQGLALAKAMEKDLHCAARLHKALAPVGRMTPELEAQMIANEIAFAMRGPKAKKDPAAVPQQVARGIQMTVKKQRVVLEGEGVTDGFIQRLESLLRARR